MIPKQYNVFFRIPMANGDLSEFIP